VTLLAEGSPSASSESHLLDNILRCEQRSSAPSTATASVLRRDRADVRLTVASEKARSRYARSRVGLVRRRRRCPRRCSSARTARRDFSCAKPYQRRRRGKDGSGQSLRPHDESHAGSVRSREQLAAGGTWAIRWTQDGVNQGGQGPAHLILRMSSAARDRQFHEVIAKATRAFTRSASLITGK